MADDAASKPPGTVDDVYESPMPFWGQMKLPDADELLAVSKHGLCEQRILAP